MQSQRLCKSLNFGSPCCRWCGSPVETSARKCRSTDRAGRRDAVTVGDSGDKQQTKRIEPDVQPAFVILIFMQLSLVYRTEKLHLFLNGVANCLCAVCKKLTWVKALALKVLACLDVLTCCLLESKLTFCVYVNL